MDFKELKLKTKRNHLRGIEYMIDAYVDSTGHRVLYKVEPGDEFTFNGERLGEIQLDLVQIEYFSISVGQIIKEWGLEMLDKCGDFEAYRLKEPLIE